ncbi:hypothetical protein [Streptomyces sp. NPDC003247]|uniref:hypothetical protein n=1 Tax=Streptomyces sp. NPDC003247 TaxID=3364677 RepID=UPI003688895D
MKKSNSTVEGPGSLVCTARPPLSSAILDYLANLIRDCLKKIGSRWRALPTGKIAGTVLAVCAVTSGPATWLAATRYTAPP